MENNNRIEHLDSLRGLASIIVVFSHFFLAYGIDINFKAVTYSPLHFFYDGFAAVTFFFVLSGFVLTLSLYKSKIFNLNSFYLKRVFRIMPSYLFVLVISVLFYRDFIIIQTKPESTNWINAFWAKPLDVNNFVKQMFFILPTDTANLVFQNWTLNIEIIFSFILPFLYLILKKTNIYVFICFNLILLILFDVPIFIIHFSLGIILALNKDLIVSQFIFYEKKYRILIFIITILLCTYRFTIPMYYYYIFRKFNFLNNENLIWVLTGLGSFLILLYSLSFKQFSSFLSKSFFKLLGRLSYSIYLVHVIVLIYFVPKFINSLNEFEIYNKYLIWILSLFFLLALTIIFSFILTKLVELPIVKYGGKFIKKYGL